MYDRGQFRSLVVRVLQRFDPALAHPVAIELVLGTAAQESRFGTYLRQVRGPALGAFQIEPETARWLLGKYAPQYPELLGRTPEELEWDLRLGIILCRLRYWVSPLELPSDSAPEKLAKYWKAIFNSPLGAGREEDFVRNYTEYVSG